MADDALETLFLLEILVDNVHFDNPPENKELRETCVSFQFLDYPPLMVCEEDFVYLDDKDFNRNPVQFKSGKSVFFAYPSLGESNSPVDVINAWVTRRVGKTDKTQLMGATQIQLTGSVQNILKISEKQLDCCPMSKSVKDTYPLRYKNNNIGSVSAFIRLSCFGKMVITKFEVTGQEKYRFQGQMTTNDNSGCLDDDDDKKKGPCAERSRGNLHSGKAQSKGIMTNVSYPTNASSSGQMGGYPQQNNFYPGAQGGGGMYPGQGVYPGQGPPMFPPPPNRYGANHPPGGTVTWVQPNQQSPVGAPCNGPMMPPQMNYACQPSPYYPLNATGSAGTGMKTTFNCSTDRNTQANADEIVTATGYVADNMKKSNSAKPASKPGKPSVKSGSGVNVPDTPKAAKGGAKGAKPKK